MVESLGRNHILWANGAIVGLVFSDHTNKRLLRLVCGLLLLVDAFIGFSSSLAIAIIALLMLRSMHSGRSRLIGRYGVIFSVLICAVFLFAYKGIYSAIKAGEWTLVFDRLTSASYYLDSIAESEPFTIQAMLNEVIRRDFSTGFDSLISATYQLVIFAPELGARTVAFNDEFQKALFGDVGFGLGLNIWAQMFAIGGWLMVLAFGAAFSGSLAIAINWALRSSDTMRATIVVLMSPWCFYIHRNDLSYQISLEKRLLLVLACSYILHLLFTVLRRKSHDLRTRSTRGAGGQEAATKCIR